MTRQQAFPSTYLSKDDLPQPITATITTVVMEDVAVEGGRESKPVATFAGDTIKPLILNLCNWQTLEDNYGKDSDAWAGKAVEIYVDPSVMFAGRRVGGLRLRIPAPSTNGHSNGNGHVNGTGGWTLQQAIDACAEAGITAEQMKDHLRGHGHNAWVKAVCTPLIEAMIRQQAEMDAIPF